MSPHQLLEELALRVTLGVHVRLGIELKRGGDMRLAQEFLDGLRVYFQLHQSRSH